MMKSPVLPVFGIFPSEKVFESWVLEFMNTYFPFAYQQKREIVRRPCKANGRIEVCPK